MEENEKKKVDNIIDVGGEEKEVARQAEQAKGAEDEIGADQAVTQEETEKIVVIYSPDPEKGLSNDEVNQRKAAGLLNIIEDTSSKTVKDIIKENCLTYFNMIFAVLTVLVIISGNFKDMLFLPVIIANTCIGIFQEINSKRILDKLKVISATKINVVREGQLKKIKINDIVVNDIIEFSAGDQICADAVVKSGEVYVNESLLTGESDEVVKTEGDELLSGSFIVAGKCRACAEKVGMDSYAAKLTLEAKKINNKEQSQMLRSMNRFLIFVGIAIIPIGVLLFVQHYGMKGYSFSDSISATVAAVVGMIPEGMYLLTSVALAVSAGRLALKKVLLHDMKCIETLARVNILCLDKTGTITEPEMEVNDVIPVGDEGLVESKKLLNGFINTQTSANETSEAIKKYFTNKTEKLEGIPVPFSSEYKYSAVNLNDGRCYVLGAPEFVMGQSETFEKCRKECDSLSKEGKRVLLFAEYKGKADGGKLIEGINPICLVTISNPIRKEAVDTFKYFAGQGVEIKVISGDNPVTVSAVAREAEISGADSYVDMSLINDDEIGDICDKFTVFGRVTPKQKRLLVNALKAKGNTVAMTGDGVNDVLALKDADCSIAMASGSSAAAQAAQIVLIDSNFSKLPNVVAEGRRVVNNIQRSSSLFIVKNIFSFLLSVSTIIFMLDYPLKAPQISLISTFTIGIPAFLLTLENNFDIIKGGFMKNVLYKALPGGLTDFGMVFAFVIYSGYFGLDGDDVSVVSTILLAMVGFLILYKIMQPLNLLRGSVLIGVIAAFILCVVFMNDLFEIHGVSVKTALLLGIFIIATESVFRYLTKLFELVSGIISKIKQKLHRRDELEEEF